MNWILDLIVLAIIVICVILTAKKGFVKSVIEIAGFVLAILLSLYLSTPVAEFTFDKVIEPSVLNTVETAIKEDTNNISETVWNVLPEYVQNAASSFGVDKNSLSLKVNEIDTAATIAKTVSDTVVRPIAVSVIKLIVTVILFIILSVVFKFLAKVLNKLFSFSIVGKANKLLGGILGLVKGVIYAIIFILLSNFIISVTGGFWCFMPEYVGKSILFNGILGLIIGVI